MRRILLLSSVAALLCAGAAVAGVFGTVRGIVHDAQHRPIEGAEVTLEARRSDWEKQTTSDADGQFQIDAVPAGEYILRIHREGFRYSENLITVAADTAPLRHFPLEVATLAQEVEVNETPDRTYPDSSSAPASVSRGDISAAPGASRTNSLTMITDYVPGAYIVHDQLHIRGGHQVSWVVDGVPVPNTNIASNVGAQFDPKDIDTIEISRGGYSAEYGDRTYGVFNVVTRSGFERDREAELYASYGSHNTTDNQISFGDHTEKFAYYASAGGNRTDLGLETPVRENRHNLGSGVGGFVSLIYNPTARDQVRLVTSLRRDHFQIPNTPEQQAAGIRDLERERDTFVNFSWVHTAGPGLLLTVAPFYHYNRAAFDGGPNDAPMTTLDHRSSRYAGGQVSLGVTRGRHNARFGLYGFAQRDNESFGLRANDGTGRAIFERARPGGQLTAVFLEDQYRLTDWLTLNGGIRLTHFSGRLDENAASPRAGAAIRIPKLHWVLRGFYGRYYQAPPLSSATGPVLAFALDQGFAFLPLRGERDEQQEFGLTIPVRGWTIDVANFRTHARNFFDHEVLGNSNIFFPVTIERARIRGWEATVRSPRIGGRAQFHLNYSRQFAEGAGGVSGGLTDFGPPEAGLFFLDHDQRHTLTTGYHVVLPWRFWTSGNLTYGSGLLDGDGPSHLPGHTTFDFSIGKPIGERLSVTFSTLNAGNTHFLLDNSNTFGGTHFNNPRQFMVELRYRFRY